MHSSYKPAKAIVEIWLGRLSMCLATALVWSVFASWGLAQSKSAPFVPMLSDQETWTRLPELRQGTRGDLPNWAKAIASELPRTAAAMMELDATHRLRSPLDPALRAKLRWAIAKANRCDYSQACALLDLRNAGADDATCNQLVGQPANWQESDRLPLEFVQLLTSAAPTIPDELFNRLRERFGDRGVAAMVLLTAYGNFQDRIVLGLNLGLEVHGPLAPLDIKFVDGALQMAPILPQENGQAKYADGQAAVVPVDDSWTNVSYDQLQSRLELQRDRQPRLPVPTWDEIKGKLPSVMAAKPTSIRWSLVNYGYAHELAIPWIVATRTHWSEAPADRIFEESLFWVQTRAINCNYCMGHCEMLMEVAGMNKLEVAKRTRLLAETNWSMFPPKEQRAYAFARKLSRTPWEMTQSDYQSLEADFGKQKAMSIFWWLCRGLYMTRISDGFQLPLERENVFGNPAPGKG